MLVLSRKKGEEIVIEGGIVVTVVSIRGDKVRLGITAPRGVEVHRKEVKERIEAEEEAEVKADFEALQAKGELFVTHDEMRGRLDAQDAARQERLQRMNSAT